MRKHIQKVGLLVLLAMTVTMSGFAQDDVQFTFFPWVTSYYNAGGIGEQSNTLCFTADYSNKYLGWGDLSSTAAINNDSAAHTAPQDFLFSIESYLRKLHGSIGVTLVHDRIGYYSNTGVKLGYAYKLRVGGGHLGIGAQVSLYNQSIDASGLHPIVDGDPVIQQLSESTLDLDFNFGVLYKTDQWYVGLGWTQIVAMFDKNQALRVSGEHGPARSSQLYLHGGYTWVVPFNPNWEIIPQALVKTDLKTYQWEILALARYNGVFWGGVGYRFQDAVSLAFGARPFYNSSNIYLKGLDLGVSYGFTANLLGYKKNRSFGDVEVVVRYCFDIYKPEVFSGYGNSRYIYKNRY